MEKSAIGQDLELQPEQRVLERAMEMRAHLALQEQHAAALPLKIMSRCRTLTMMIITMMTMMIASSRD
jgi:hypothetical protein